MRDDLISFTLVGGPSDGQIVNAPENQSTIKMPTVIDHVTPSGRRCKLIAKYRKNPETGIFEYAGPSNR